MKWRSHAVLTVTALVFCLAACQRVESAAQDRASRSQAQAAARLPPDSVAGTVTLELDAPPEFTAKGPDGQPVIRGFQVGFFAGPRLVNAVEIPRDSVRLVSGKIRLEVPLSPVTQSSNSSVALKVRALSAGRPGAWSAEAGSVTLPVVEELRRTRPEAQRARGGRDGQRPDDTARDRTKRRQARRLGLSDLEGHDELKALLTRLLDDSMTLEQAVGSFGKPQDLATAALLAQKLKLPFAKLCQAVDAAPRDPLIEGLKAVQPSIDASAEIKAVAQQARKLVGRQRAPRQRDSQAQ